MVTRSFPALLLAIVVAGCGAADPPIGMEGPGDTPGPGDPGVDGGAPGDGDLGADDGDGGDGGAATDAGLTDQGFPKGDLSWPADAGTTVPVIIPRTNINASAAPGGQVGGDIAIDPTDTPYFNHLLAASDDDAAGQVGLYETDDGATTWRTHVLLLPETTYTGATRHPSVAYDTQGDAFVTAIAFDPSGASSTVAISTRPAAAGSFGRLAVIPGTSADRQRIVVDRAAQSPHRDAIYLAWTDGQHVRVAASTDAGASFGAAVQVDDDGASVTNPYPTVAADGTVYVAWLDVTRAQLRIDRSVDGGASWGTDHVIAQLATSGASTPTSAAPSSGARNAVSCDVDRSNGPRRHAVYCAYHDLGQGLDVFLRRSGDGGATWTAPLRLGGDAPGVPSDQFLPRVMIDDGNSKVSVAWYDTRDDAAHGKTNVYFTRANDGAAFVAPAKVTNQLTDETRAGADPAAFGESLGMEAFGGRARLFWTDSRSGDEDVFSAIIDFAHFVFAFPGSDTVTVPSGGTGTLDVSVTPSGPFTSSVQLSLLGLPAGATASWSVDPVAPNGTSTLTIGGTAAPGTYTVSVKGIGGGEQDSRAFSLVVQ